MKRILYPLFGLLSFYSTPNYADQPIGAGFDISYDILKGLATPDVTPDGDTQYIVKLRAGSKILSEQYLAVVFPNCGEDPQTKGKPLSNLAEVIRSKGVVPSYVQDWKSPDQRWRTCPTEDLVLIQPGQSAETKIQVDFLRCSDEGLSPRLNGDVYVLERNQVELGLKDPQSLARTLRNKPADSQLTIDPYFRMNSKCEWYAGTYKDIFGAGQSGNNSFNRMGLKSYTQNAATLPVDIAAYRRNIPLPGVVVNDGGARLKETLVLVRSQGSGLAGAQICYNDNGTPNAADLPNASPITAQADVALSGTFSTKWTSDHALHPAWGFAVEAWVGSTKVGSTWVQSNGTWVMNVPASSSMRVLYVSNNTYYRPQDQSGNTYRWGHDFSNLTTSRNIGHWYADTDGGAANGVGELTDAAMWMWSRLYWDGGVNPVPSSPLKFWFPNTWYDCGDGSGVPWSCANTSGEIWLTAAHGTEADVVVHEMSHQLNNRYWGNKRPAGAGGSHTLNGCYSTRLGMALREGFADFMPAWVGYPYRDVASGGFGSGRWAMSYDNEDNSTPPNCDNGWENEVWVARTFWDLHDTHADGDDNLWFIHKGAVISLYLSNGIANDGDARDMRYYENIYRNAASLGHQNSISNIFNQNRM